MLWKRLKAKQASVAQLKPKFKIAEDMGRAVFSLLGYLSKNYGLSMHLERALALY